MRYRAAEKLEIIRLVEQSSLSVRRTLAQLGIPRATFYRLVPTLFGARCRGLERWPAGAAPRLE
jgi:DNA-binding IclR family transcriptional regulator